MHSIRASDIEDWLDAFATCVRDRDFDRARTLFADEAAGFGTVAEQYAGVDDLVSAQWSEVWTRTSSFTFTDVTGHWLDQELCAVAATWRSVGADGERERTGRTTLVLRRNGRSLRAVHSHFSMTPGTRS